MVYAVSKQNEQECAWLFYRWEDYHRAFFNPDIEVICTIELGRLKGKTYQEKKADIQSKAIEFSNSKAPGLYLSDSSMIYNYFYRYGKRYGLLTEFYENAIC